MKALIVDKNKWIINWVIRSLIWIFVPLAIVGGIKSCSTFNEAETHLTKKTVSVRGYYRKDGTYVSGYNRRPPGGVARDAPWVRKRFYMGLIFVVCLGTVVIYPYFTLNNIKDRVHDRTTRINNLISRRALIHKKIEGLQVSKSLISPDTFANLPSYPNQIRYSSYCNCKFDHSDFPKTNFYIKYKAKVNYYTVCLEHLRSMKRIGQNQLSSDYLPEIIFYDSYNSKFIEFKENFKNASKSSKNVFNQTEIQEYFYFYYQKNTANSTYPQEQNLTS